MRQSRSRKAPEDWRSPRRFARTGGCRLTRQRLGLRRPSAAFPCGISNCANVNQNCHILPGVDVVPVFSGRQDAALYVRPEA
jgi:hypothetical protein